MSLMLPPARTPTAATASTSAANHPATHVLTPAVARAWRSATGAASWLQLDLGTSQAVAGVAVSGVNFSTATVQADNSATPTTGRGTLVCGTDRQGRVKGSLAFSASVRYIRFNLSGSPLDGSAFWAVGAAYAFAAAATLPSDPLYGGSRIDWHDPQVRADLPNGTVETWATGPAAAELTLGFRGTETDDIESLKRAARAGVVWFDFGVAADRGLQFPVRHREAQTTARFEGYNRRAIDVVLREAT